MFVDSKCPPLRYFQSFWYDSIRPLGKDRYFCLPHWLPQDGAGAVCSNTFACRLNRLLDLLSGSGAGYRSWSAANTLNFSFGVNSPPDLSQTPVKDALSGSGRLTPPQCVNRQHSQSRWGIQSSRIKIVPRFGTVQYLFSASFSSVHAVHQSCSASSMLQNSRSTPSSHGAGCFLSSLDAGRS